MRYGYEDARKKIQIKPLSTWTLLISDVRLQANRIGVGKCLGD